MHDPDVDEIKARLLESLRPILLQAQGQAVTPHTLASIQAGFLQVARGWAEHYSQLRLDMVQLDVRVHPDDPTNILITPKNLYTGLVFLGVLDRTPEEVEAKKTSWEIPKPGSPTTPEVTCSEFSLTTGVFHLNHYHEDDTYEAWFTPNP